METKKENNDFREIYNKLMSSKKIIITLHKGPDGDSIGSCGTMKYFLEKKGKEVKVISPDKTSEDYLGLNFLEEVEYGKTLEDFDLNNFDIILILDSSKPSQVKISEDCLKNHFVINIDHHETNPLFGDLNYVDSKSSSTCSVLLRMFLDQKTEINEELATRLMIGVYTDSRGFTARNAIQALKDANILLDKKARYLEILEKTRTSLRMKKYFSYLLINTEYKGKIAWSSLPKEKIQDLKLSLSEIRGGIDELRRLKEFDIVFTLSELEDRIKVSFRTSEPGIDVSKFAHSLGGGGHKGAASADIYEMNLEEAKEKVLETIENYKNQ